MKKATPFILIIIHVLLCSWRAAQLCTSNANSWSIRLGKKVLLASWNKNDMGETAIFNRKIVKTTDTLFMDRYLCGSDGRNASVSIEIKNAQGELITTSAQKNNSLNYTAAIPVNQLLNSPKCTNEQIIALFFTITNKQENLHQTVLLAKLMIKN